MKRTLQIIVAATLLLTFNHLSSTAFAQGTAFTYQGQLQNNGSPVSGTYNLTFTLFAASTGGTAVAGPVTNNAVAVSNGLFTVTIDFGAAVWNSQINWLEIRVESNSANSFITLAPRQQVTPTPYAIYAENANALSGTVSAFQLTSIGNDNFFVGPSGNSTTTGYYNTANGMSALGDDTSGNNNTANGMVALGNNFSGSNNTANGMSALDNNFSGSDNTANGFQALYQNTTGSYNTANGVDALYNNNSGPDNTADGVNALGQLGSNGAGGANNIALGDNAGSAFTGNESFNIDIGNIGVAGESGVIRIGTPGAETATYLAGSVLASSMGIGTTSAGQLLQIGSISNAVDGMIRLGCGNGSEARLWDIGVPYGNTDVNGTNYSFIIRDASAGALRFMIDWISGDVCIGTTASLGPLTVGSAYCTGTAWQNGSDRNSKKDFSRVSSEEVLAKVAALPITEWQYKVDAPGVEHLGPIAQDFHAAFGLNGTDDKHISTVDEGGVALAAIQGLNEELKAQSAENAQLKQENVLLAKRLDELEAEVNTLARNNH